MTIKKTSKGFELDSKTTGKKLGGPYKTKEEAMKREKQVQFFKNDAKYQKDHGGKHIPIKKKK